MTSRAFSNQILRSAAALATLGLTTFLYANQIELRAFKLHRVQVPVLAPGTLARVGKREGEPFRILHVSDFHMLPDQKLKQKWVASLDALNPDLVINTGDNLGSDKAVPSVLAALGPLLNRPGAFVFGTNDYFAPRPVNPLKYLTGKKRKPSRVELPWRGMRAAFIEHGWQDATHARLEFVAGGVKVALSGVDDPHHELEDYSQIAGAPNADADIAIGLSHSPEPHVLDAFAEDGYDLVLSGHTHGGQIVFMGMPLVPTGTPYTKGRYVEEQSVCYVNNGSGHWFPIRINCPREITVITFFDGVA